MTQSDMPDEISVWKGASTGKLYVNNDGLPEEFPNATRYVRALPPDEVARLREAINCLQLGDEEFSLEAAEAHENFREKYRKYPSDVVLNAAKLLLERTGDRS